MIHTDAAMPSEKVAGLQKPAVAEEGSAFFRATSFELFAVRDLGHFVQRSSATISLGKLF